MVNEFLKISDYPFLSERERLSFGRLLKILLAIYGTIFLFNIGFGIFIQIVEAIVVKGLHYKSILSQFSNTMNRTIKKNGFPLTLLYVCLIGPLMEESLFRLPLSFKRKHMAISAGMAFYFIVASLPYLKHLSLIWGKWPAIGLIIIPAILIAFVAYKLIPEHSQFSYAARRRTIIASMLVFGLMHMFNYLPFQLGVLWAYPFYVLPQLFMGWGLTFMRLRGNFWWGFALHCLINSVSMGLFWVQLQAAPHLHAVLF